MKYIGLLLILFVQSVSIYTQDTTNTVDRRFTMYMDVSSGVVNANTDELPLLKGNETEFGLDYSQNFTTAPWLRVGFKGYVLLHLDIISTESNITGIGPQGVYIKDPSASMYMQFFNIFSLEIDTLLRIKPALFYTIYLPANQYIKFYTEAQLYTLSKPTATASFLTADQYLSLFEIRTIYNIFIGRGWNYQSEFRFRFDGKGGANGIGGFIDPDSWEAFNNSFTIRWNNSFSFSSQNGFGFYTQVRYQIERITHNIFEPLHKVSLHTGMSYTFNFQGNE